MGTKRDQKLIMVGKSSVAVIIPKPWIEYYGLEAGDEIEVITNETVIIRPKTGKTEEGK